MRTTDVISWESEPEVWELAARGDAPTAALRADFLSFWSPVSTQTLAALLMWTHSGWGLSKLHQRPPVDATAVHVLSTAVLQQVRALLVQGDGRSIPELAIDAHLETTDRLLGSGLYGDELLQAPLYCSDCLWQHLSSLANTARSREALQWFAGARREVECTDHLQALNKVLSRLKESTPQLRDAEWELTSLEVGSTLHKYSPLVIPGTVRLLLPALMVTGSVGAALISPAPGPEMVLMTQPRQERRTNEPFAVPVTEIAAQKKPIEKPEPQEPSSAQQRPDTSQQGTKETEAKSQDASRQHIGPPMPPSVVVSAALITDRRGNIPVGPLPQLTGKPGGTGTSGSSSAGPTTPSNQRGKPDGGTANDKAMVSYLAHKLSIQLQRRGKPCTVEGRVFSISKNKQGLLIDGNSPRLEDIPVMRAALKECKR